MINTTTKYVAAIVACGVVLFLAIPRNPPSAAPSRADQTTSSQSQHDATMAIPKASAPPVPERVAIAAKIAPAPRASVVIAKPATRASALTKLPERPEPEPIVSHEVAREALSDVGADGEAEIIWASAINDPALSADQRRNLIEDLNEDGFADPKNITVDDVPLIQSRMRLIEQLAPDAMDQVNSDAFDEAYKDLRNMLKRLGRS